MLTKNEELFTREKDARDKAVTDLAWLRLAWRDGLPGPSLSSTSPQVFRHLALINAVINLDYQLDHGAGNAEPVLARAQRPTGRRAAHRGRRFIRTGRSVLALALR